MRSLLVAVTYCELIENKKASPWSLVVELLIIKHQSHYTFAAMFSSCFLFGEHPRWGAGGGLQTYAGIFVVEFSLSAPLIFNELLT